MNTYLTDASVHVPEPPMAPPEVPAPTYDEIAERALELFMNRRNATDRDLQDWVEAERQLRLQKAR